MNNLKKLILFGGLLLFAMNLLAQKEVTVTGVVTDEKGETLIGVNVVVKNQPGFGVVTGIDGDYKIKTGAQEVLVFSFIGYDKQEIPITGRTKINVTMKPSTTSLDEVTVVGAGVQRKVSVLGAVTTVNVETMKMPTSNLSNALAGNVAGIIAMQKSGEPGENGSTFWIRGKSTFGANDGALVLVDGIERNFNEVNAEDIESFSVLKDASATAIYGQRGANGVIIITTKRGQEGKVRINFKAEYGNQHPTRMPKYVDGVRYGELVNEARISSDMDPMYTGEEMDIIRYGLDPDLYPNVDWQEEVLKKSTSNYRAMLNISGGGSTARYYISGGYYSEDGMYKTDALNRYKTNAKYKRYNFRSNVDVNLTKSTILELGVGGWIVDQNKPGSSSDDIWGSLSRLTATTVPIRYSTGEWATYGLGNTMNPYVLLTQTGYKTKWENKLETNLGLKQELDFITKGLKFYGRFSYDAWNYHETSRLRQPDLYKAERLRDRDGNLVLRKKGDKSPMAQTTISKGDRRYYGELNLNYDRVFAEKHRVGGLLFFYMQSKTAAFNAGGELDNVFAAVPKRNVALSGRATYAYDDRYFAEINFGYTGSENFEKGKRFGFFPAVAAGWMISNEKFVKDNISWLNLLKVRYSYGEVGNDVLPQRDEKDQRFPYISTIGTGGDYSFGDQGVNNKVGIRINRFGTSGLTWEVAKKHNLGIDLGLFDNFTMTVDFFRDNRTKIFMERGHIPYTVGLDVADKYLRPWANVGQMVNKGVDGTMAYTRQFGEVTLTVRGNMTYSKTEVIDYDEAANAKYYQMTKGYRWGQRRGLVAVGLFKDQYEIEHSPVQDFGTVLRPGDIKYKDVNGDGKINDDDKVPIGYTDTPGLIYGLGASAQWKGFDLSVLFQGSGNNSFFINGSGVYPFIDGESGNILKQVSNDGDRWIPREISGTAETERQDAVFPRLSYGKNENNFKESTFWLRNARYLRLKNVELGYTLPNTLTRKWLMENVRFYFVGYNLACWDKFKWWDPEINSSDGAKYPLQRNLTVGVTLNF